MITKGPRVREEDIFKYSVWDGVDWEDCETFDGLIEYLWEIKQNSITEEDIIPIAINGMIIQSKFLQDKIKEAELAIWDKEDLEELLGTKTLKGMIKAGNDLKFNCLEIIDAEGEKRKLSLYSEVCCPICGKSRSFTEVAINGLAGMCKHIKGEDSKR